MALCKFGALLYICLLLTMGLGFAHKTAEAKTGEKGKKMAPDNIENVLRTYILPIYNDDGGVYERPQLMSQLRKTDWKKARGSAAAAIRSALDTGVDSESVDRAAYIARFFYLPEAAPLFLKFLNHKETDKQSWMKSAHAVYLIGDLGGSEERQAMAKYVTAIKLQGEWPEAYDLFAKAIAALADDQVFSPFEKNLEQELLRLKKEVNRSEEAMSTYDRLNAVKNNGLNLAKQEAKIRLQILTLKSSEEQIQTLVEKYLRGSSRIQVWAALELRRHVARGRNQEVYEAFNRRLTNLKSAQDGANEFILGCRALLALDGKLSPDLKTHFSKVNTHYRSGFLLDYE